MSAFVCAETKLVDSAPLLQLEARSSPVDGNFLYSNHITSAEARQTTEGRH